MRARRSIIAALATFSLLCCGGVSTVFIGGFFDDENALRYSLAGCGSATTVNPNTRLPSVDSLSDEQMHNAAIIIQVGQQRKVPVRGWIIAVATAMQESTLHNYGYLGDRNDHDSLGLFQQRPSAGWGTPEQVTNPAYASGKFYEKLVKVPNWQTIPLTDAAQAVQVSAFPDAYAKWEQLATNVVNALTHGAGRSAIGALSSNPQCAVTGQISAAGWTQPAHGSIVSGFRTADRPDHNGVDIGVPRGTTVVAASAGIVITAECNASLNGAPYSCDVDGSVSVLGCGWYVEIKHAGDLITRYCHMVRRPGVVVGQQVQAGQAIGISGTSGNSSGPHLHFEVHINNDPDSAGAIDPVPFMLDHGAAIGK